MEDLKQIQEFFSKPLNEGKQLDIEDFAKVVQAVTKTGHPVTVLLTPKFNEIEIITGMNAPDDMLRDLSNAVDSLGYGRNDIIIAGDSSNLSRREYSDIRRVNGGHKDYFEESINEVKVDYDFSERELIRVLRQLKRGASTEIDMIKAFTKALGRDITKDELFSESVNEVKRPEPDYKQLVKLLIMAFKHEPKARFYFNRNNGVVYFDLIGGAAYSPKKSKMRDIFGGMNPIAVNREFGRADHYEEETIKQVEQLSNGKIKAEIKELGDGVLYKLASVNEAKKLTYDNFVQMVRDDMMAGAAPDEYPSDERVRKDAKYLYNRYLQGASVDDLFEATKEEENKPVANINKHIKAIQIQLDQLGVKYKMSDNPRKPFKAIYKPINKDDKWYDNFEDIIFRYNLGGVVKTAIGEATKEEENEFHKKLDKLVHKTFGHSSDEKKYKKGDKLKIKLKNGKEFDIIFDRYLAQDGMAFGKIKNEDGEFDTKPFALDTIVEYNTGIYYHPDKEKYAVKTKQASKSGLEKVRDFVKKVMKEEEITVDDATEFKVQLKHLLDKHVVKNEELSDYEEKEVNYDELYSDYKYKVNEAKPKKGHGEKISKEVFSKLKGKTINYKGSDYKVVDSDEAVLTLKDEDGKSKTINLRQFNISGMIDEIMETIELGKNLNEELCPKGKAYIKKRQAAGEKSSAYLSGRAVKVCKGQMKG